MASPQLSYLYILVIFLERQNVGLNLSPTIFHLHVVWGYFTRKKKCFNLTTFFWQATVKQFEVVLIANWTPILIVCNFLTFHSHDNLSSGSHTICGHLWTDSDLPVFKPNSRRRSWEAAGKKDVKGSILISIWICASPKFFTSQSKKTVPFIFGVKVL